MMRRLLTSVLLSLGLMMPLTTVAQQKATPELERLRADMYRLYSTDSLERFMDVTVRLKEAALKAGDERTFYRAWANQALYTFRKKSRKEGQAILEQQREYAQQHDSKFGIYSATSVNISFLSMLKMDDKLEEAYLQCIDYVHRNFPGESAAPDYVGLARIYYNHKKYDQVMDVAQKALHEPNLNVVHRQSALAYLCIAYSHVPQQQFDLKKYNDLYADYRQCREKTGRDMGLEGIVDYNYYRLNNNPQAALKAAKSIKAAVNRLNYVAAAYEFCDSFKQAYYTLKAYNKLTDSLNTDEARRITAEHTLQLSIIRAENEAKDLRLANQALELEHINDELEQRRLEEQALSLSLQKRDAELANASTKMKNDSLDRYNKDLKLSEYKSKMEAQKQAEQAHMARLWAGIAMGIIVFCFLCIYLYRRNKHAKEIETAYGKLEEAYGQLEETTKAKERIESELRIAHDIQEGMVPRIFPAFPNRQDIDLYASMKPAKEVGGDLYDFFLLPPHLRDGDERLCFCIGDVAGKGVPASLFMSVIINLFRMVAKEGLTPAQIATRLNAAVSADNINGMFATMFIGEIDLRTGVLEYCNCGHNPPAIGGSFLDMKETNAPIGLWPDLEFIGETAPDMKNRMFLLYTDGLTEAENMDQKQTGDDWLLDILRDHPLDNAHQTVDDVLEEVSKHVGDADPSDDLTILCLRIF